MEASLVDLRRKTGQIIKALQQRESVILRRRGKAIGKIVPVEEANEPDIEAHPAFGMWKDATDKPVEEVVRELRKGRFHDF